jgi:ATP-binding cassette, subfamily B, bacterial MsbA
MVSSLGATYGPLWALLQRTGASRFRLAMALGLMLVAGALESASFGLLVPLLATVTGSPTSGDLFSRLFPSLAGPNAPSRVLVLSIGILILFCIKNVAGGFAVRAAAHVRRDSLAELRRQMLHRLLHAPASAVEKLTTGEISGAFLIEAGRANRALEYALALGQRAIIAAGYAAAIVVISPRLTVATAVLGLVLGAITLFIGRRLLRQGRNLVSSNAELGREVSEAVGGLRVLRASAGEEQRKQSFDRVNVEHAQADVVMSITNHRATATTEMLGIAGAMGLTAAAHALWIAPGKLSVAHFLAFGFGLLRLLPALNQVYGMHAAVASFTGSVEKVLGWLGLPQHPVRPFGKRELGRLADGLKFEDVGYEYAAGGQKALDRVSFEIKAGETAALLGTSGSGKTTLASLLLRLREPTAGTIRFDGVDHWEYDPKSFHRAVAFVEQDPFMFNCSIADNVSYGAPWVGRADVERAIQQVYLADVVAKLPDGLDTVLGERGATLSGGQRQRLAIARAIVREPVLLILDEPTSALDAETEQEVMSAIEAVSAGRTTIIITHRTSTIERAQRIVRLSAGKLERVEVAEPQALRAGSSR